jgi:Winged helix DNA-binding domain
VDAKEIVRRRMHGHRLWGTQWTTPEEVMAHFGAMQAQEYPYAKWSIGQRCKGVSDTDVEAAFNRGAFLRTHLLRPTWHFVTAKDIRWLLALTGPRVERANKGPNERNGLDARTLAKSDKVIAKALAGGNHLTRAQVAEHLNKARLDAKAQRLGYMLMHAELQAIICSGARKGKQQTYALLDERVPETKSLDRDAALAELTRRYFTSRGPATVKDIATWASLTLADCRAGLEMVGDELETFTAGGREYWFADHGRSRTIERIDLVQVYDEYVMSYSESRDAMKGTRGSIPIATTFGMHAVLSAGRLIGHWRRDFKGDGAVIQVGFYRKLRNPEKSALGAAVDRFGRFLQAPVSISSVGYLM